MTDAQEKAREHWTKCSHDYRVACHGERNRTRKALEIAALNVLRADVEANKERREAAYAA